MRLIVGLGNPGPEYAWTRHNAGFWTVEILAERIGARFANKWSSQVANGRLAGGPTILQKPTTFMNRSGFAVAQALGYYGLSTEALIVIHDDVDLAPGRLKIKRGGGGGGHRGIASLEQQLPDREFFRVRFGVGRPEDPRADTADFVLARIPDSQRAAWRDWAKTAADAVECLIADGLAAAQNRYHTDPREGTADGKRNEAETPSKRSE